jgi:hypothetical protein
MRYVQYVSTVLNCMHLRCEGTLKVSPRIYQALSNFSCRLIL